MQLLRIDWNVLFTIINLIVLYLLLKKFLIGPVTGIMQKRKEMIEGQLADADDKRKQAGELKQQYEDMLKGAHEESVKILEEARKNAQKKYDSKVKSADDQADKIIENAQKTIELEREKTVQDLQSQIADLALVAAGKVIGEKSTEESNQSLYDQFLAKAGDSDDTDSE